MVRQKQPAPLRFSALYRHCTEDQQFRHGTAMMWFDPPAAF
jgi:hypothetical protein